MVRQRMKEHFIRAMEDTKRHPRTELRQNSVEGHATTYLDNTGKDSEFNADQHLHHDSFEPIKSRRQKVRTR